MNDGRKGWGNPAQIDRLRLKVQLAFLFVWLLPVGSRLHAFPACVFHCYACPASSFACPIGLLANYAALFPAILSVTIMPWLVLGVLVFAGALVGTRICGWVCPFGLIQDVIAKLGPKRKIGLPSWVGLGRYAVLLGLVIILPMYFGAKGLFYEEQPITVCKICPAGALEAGLPYSLYGLVKGGEWQMGVFKSTLLAVFLLVAMWVYRPWCRVLCPLGGFLALMNKVSLGRLHVESEKCLQCNVCLRLCPVGIAPVENPNSVRCIRCLRCVSCGVISWKSILGTSSKERGGETPPSK